MVIKNRRCYIVTIVGLVLVYPLYLLIQSNYNGLKTVNEKEPMDLKSNNVFIRSHIGDSHVTSVDDEPVYHRVDTTPEQTKSIPFLGNYKNPCWREVLGPRSSKIRCLPYFYSVGPAKCGTTDLNRRMIKHPQISDKVYKDPQWISNRRFERTGHGSVSSNLSEYLLIFDKAVSNDIIPSERNGYHNVVIGDFSAANIWYTKDYLDTPSLRFHTNAEVIKHLNPDAKIIVTLRNPVTRAYSDCKHFTPNASPNHFHTEVSKTMHEFNQYCRNSSHLKRCMFNNSNKMSVNQFIYKGVYYIYVQDFLNTFPREQIYITQLEVRTQKMKSTLKEIFSFLELDPMSNDRLEKVASQDITAKDTHGVDDMLNKTKHLLQDFYRPFNEKLSQLLGPEFNYNMYQND